jgi:integrase
MAEKKKRAAVKARSRGIHLLTPFEVENAKPDDGRFVKRLLDGKGLYLQATLGKHGAINRNWIFRYELDGKRHDMGIGPTDVCGLAMARQKAAECRLLLLDGIDPLEARETARAAQEAARRAKLAEEAKAVTFKKCFEDFYRRHSKTWKNAKHRAQWRATIETYAFPVIGDLNVADIETAHVQRVLAPIWDKVPETATRVQKRIEKVLDFAKASELRTGENPARWQGHIKTLFGVAQKNAEHHAALAFAEAPAFMADLRARKSTSARALEFLILTAARTAEVIGATWDEIGDLKNKTWKIPASRMKGAEEHSVPLSDRAVEILKALPHKRGGYVFAHDNGHPMSNMAMLQLLRGMHPGLTVHGFRSTFKDWCSERTHFPNIVSEMALAHKISDKVEAAYRRGDLFTKRANLMKQWSAYLAKPAPTGATVTDLAEQRAKRQ